MLLKNIKIKNVKIKKYKLIQVNKPSTIPKQYIIRRRSNMQPLRHKGIRILRVWRYLVNPFRQRRHLPPVAT